MESGAPTTQIVGIANTENAVVLPAAILASREIVACNREARGPEPCASFLPQAELTDSEDQLNWDVSIRLPKARRSGTIEATLEYGGRGAPLPIEDPWA